LPEALSISFPTIALNALACAYETTAPAPWLFAILNVPHAVVTGGVTGTLLSYLLRQQGVAPHAIANQRALLLLPGTLFFLWSPVTDFLLRRRTWLLVSSAAASVAVMLALWMKSYASRGAVTLLWTASCLILLGSAAMGGLVASLMRQDQKTRVGCFLQAGNLGGGSTLRRRVCCCWRPTSAN
jgi:PAT family beta-lactamase induction signal transducer AmpG